MTTAITLPDLDTTKAGLQAIKAFQDACHQHMVLDHDYGVIPGTGTKPTLLKPGAEKILRLFNPPLVDMYDIVAHEDWDKPLFHYRISCRLYVVGTHPLVQVGEGLGECNSMESKYRWREQSRSCPICGAEAIIKGKAEFGGGWLCFRKKGGCGSKWDKGATVIEDQKVGRVENDDIFSQVNTLLKMAKKRALVDAALSVGRLSEIFTQDLDELPREGATVAEGTVVEPHTEAPRTAAQPRNGNRGGETTGEIPDGPPLNHGALFMWSFQSFGYYQSKVLVILEVKVAKEITDLKAAWEKVKAFAANESVRATEGGIPGGEGGTPATEEGTPATEEGTPAEEGTTVNSGEPLADMVDVPLTDVEVFLWAMDAYGYSETVVRSDILHLGPDEEIPNLVAAWETIQAYAEAARG